MVAILVFMEAGLLPVRLYICSVFKVAYFYGDVKDAVRFVAFLGLKIHAWFDLCNICSKLFFGSPFFTQSYQTK